MVRPTFLIVEQLILNEVPLALCFLNLILLSEILRSSPPVVLSFHFGLIYGNQHIQNVSHRYAGLVEAFCRRIKCYKQQHKMEDIIGHINSVVVQNVVIDPFDPIIDQDSSAGADCQLPACPWTQVFATSAVVEDWPEPVFAYYHWRSNSQIVQDRQLLQTNAKNAYQQ